TAKRLGLRASVYDNIQCLVDAGHLFLEANESNMLIDAERTGPPAEFAFAELRAMGLIDRAANYIKTSVLKRPITNGARDGFKEYILSFPAGKGCHEANANRFRSCNPKPRLPIKSLPIA